MVSAHEAHGYLAAVVPAAAILRKASTAPVLLRPRWRPKREAYAAAPRIAAAVAAF
jgi:hypothetical protein